MGPNWTHAEGFILGVGAEIFTITDQVIVYGVSAGVVYGLIYWIAALRIWNACVWLKYKNTCDTI